MPSRSIEFYTDAFEWAHGKRPSGRGSWAFSFYRNGSLYRSPEGETTFFAPPGLYSEAKRWARAKAREIGATDIAVQS